MRVVLDTNVVVSALLRSGGLPEAVLTVALDRIAQLCISEPVLKEYQEVLSRPKLGIARKRVETALKRIREVSLWVAPSTPVAACIDPDDDIFVECAVAAEADYLVTGNSAHFPEVWGNTQIVTPREFIGIVISDQRGV